MAPKGRGRKKAEVAEEKLEVQDVANEGTKAKMGGKVTKAAKKVVTNGEKSNDVEVNGSGEPQAENGVGEEPVETDSGPDVATSDKVASKRGRKAKAKKEEPAEDEEQIETVSTPDVVANEKVASKRGRKAKAKKEESAEDEKSSNVQEKATDEEQIEAGSAPEVPTNDKVASKRGRKANAKKEESAEDEAKEESSNMERGDEAIAKDVPAKRGRKAAKIQNVGDSAKDEDKLETKTVEAKAPNSRRKLKPDAEPDSVEEPTEARTTRTRKVQLKEGSVEKEATSKGSGRKRKNVGKPEPEVAKKVKDEKHHEVDENRQLKVALKRNKSLDEMARQQREDEDEADAFEEPKVKNVKGPAKGKGKRAAASDVEESQPTKKPKESANSKGAAKKEKDKIPDVTALNFDNESKTKDGKPWNLKIATWNVNGIRAWLEKNGMSFLHHEKPDIMCIQETKCSDDKLPPEVNVEGYHCYWLAGDKDGYSGVGLLSKEKPISVQYGINVEKHDNEGRVITAEYDEFYLVTTYIPNAGRGLVRLDYRQEWDEDFRSYLKKLDKKKPVVLCGDLNVAHEEIDLANPKTNKKNAGFTKEEREGFSTLLSEGFVDTFRHLYPDQKGAYTFWTYMMNARAKNVGWRLDYFVVSERLIDHLCDNVIRKDVYGSDHCPITLFLHV